MVQLPKGTPDAGHARGPILVAGYGSIGRRHVGNLRALGVGQIAVCDPDPQRVSSAESEYDITGYSGFQEALDLVSPEAVLVCTPPNLHVPQALAAIRSGAHVFVEKPLSHSVDGVDELIAEAEARGRVVQVGYNLRFHPGLKRTKALLEEGAIGRVMWARAELGHYLPDWRPWQDYRESYTARRSMGGGIILDGSHEIDYMRWLFGEVAQVYCLADVLSDLEVDAEDTASIVMRFVAGCVGEVHLDFVQRPRVRSCKIVGTEGTLLWDYLDGSIKLYSADDSDGKRIDVSCDPNDMYLAEMVCFLRCLSCGQPPPVGADSARRVLEIALAAHESAATQRAVSIALLEPD